MSVDIAYRLIIGHAPARDPKGREWCRTYDCQSPADRCPPIGSRVLVEDLDKVDWAVGRVIDQLWTPEGGHVTVTLHVESISDSAREQLGIAPATSATAREAIPRPTDDSFVIEAKHVKKGDYILLDHTWSTVAYVLEEDARFGEPCMSIELEGQRNTRHPPISALMTVRRPAEIEGERS